MGGFVSGLIFIKLFDIIPRLGLSEGLRKYTGRKTTPRLQSILPQKQSGELDLAGIIKITPKEAADGTKKLISIPYGLRKKNLIVTVPPGVKEGTRLRLKGLGQKKIGGNQGDLFLDVRIID